MVGVEPDCRIHRIVTLEEKETPGLGESVATPKFLDQFIGHDAASGRYKTKKNGGIFDGITGATVSSEAAMDAIIKAFPACAKARTTFQE